MKPPPQGIVWSARTRRCPRCLAVVRLAYVVWRPDGTRAWACVACLTPADLGGDGRPVISGLPEPERTAKIVQFGLQGADPSLQGPK